MLLLCVIFRILEVIDRFITSFAEAAIVLRMRKLENCVGGALQKQLFLAR